MILYIHFIMVVGSEVVLLGLMAVECYTFNGHLHKTFCHGPVYIV